eukprot:4354794-Amphidinium_carterae.1
MQRICAMRRMVISTCNCVLTTLPVSSQQPPHTSLNLCTQFLPPMASAISCGAHMELCLLGRSDLQRRSNGKALIDLHNGVQNGGPLGSKGGTLDKKADNHSSSSSYGTGYHERA